MLSVLGDDVHVLALVAGQDAAVALEQQLGEAEDRVQGGAQLVAHVRQELRLVLVGAFQFGVDRPQSRRLLGREVKEVRLLDSGCGVLRKEGEELDGVAIQRAAVVDGEHAQQLLTDHHGEAGEGLDAFFRHPGIERELAVVGRVVSDDRHTQLGHLADLPHAALHPSGNRRRVARRVMTGPPPERTVALLQQPDLGCREPEVAGQRGGHDIEQLRLEQLLVHLVDRSVE